MKGNPAYHVLFLANSLWNILSYQMRGQTGCILFRKSIRAYTGGALDRYG